MVAGFCLTFDSVYPCGSQRIIDHLSNVKAGFKEVAANPTIRLREAEDKPVVRHFKSTLKMGMYANESPLYHTLGLMAPYLTWEQGNNHLSEELTNKYAYTEIIGPRGPIVCQQMIMGMLLLGPDCHYPRHRHPRIEESYICLGGYANINDGMILTTDGFTIIPPNQPHWIKTDQDIPTLLAYAWIASPQTLANYTLEFD